MNLEELKKKSLLETESILLLSESFYSPSESSSLLDHFIKQTPWRQDQIHMFDRTYDVPRLQQWYGDTQKAYTWSGIRMEPLPWNQELLEIRDAIQKATNHEFNSVLLNYYRDGNDTVGWHSDNETELGEAPVIASLSLGVSRDFVLRRVIGKPLKIKIPLTNGSLLVMSGQTQANWQHTIPRRKKIDKPRVNLTFRLIF